jgi:hypothetical protein
MSILHACRIAVLVVNRAGFEPDQEVQTGEHSGGKFTESGTWSANKK